MIPIWIAVIIAGVTYWIGFFVNAALAAGRDKPIFPPTKNMVKPPEDLTTMEWEKDDEAACAVARQHMENERVAKSRQGRGTGKDV